MILRVRLDLIVGKLYTGNLKIRGAGCCDIQYSTDKQSFGSLQLEG